MMGPDEQRADAGIAAARLLDIMDDEALRRMDALYREIEEFQAYLEERGLSRARRCSFMLGMVVNTVLGER
jgi:hypothetical protein